MPADELADRISAVTPAAPSWMSVATALLGLVIATAPVVDRAHPVFYHANVIGTLVHEAGHAAVALVTSGTVHRLEITSPDSGTTESTTLVGLRSVLTSAAGYAAVPLAGLGSAALLRAGHAPAVTALLGALGLAALPMARGLLSIATTLGAAVLAAGLVWLDQPVLHVFVAHLVAWLLLASGPVSLWPLLQRWWHGLDTGDAATLQDETGVPWFIWVAAWAALSVWCLWTSLFWFWS